MNSKTILHRALLVMLLAILGAGCAPPDPATDPSRDSAPAQERREGKLILTAKLDGAAVVAVLVRETLCRDRAPVRGAVVVVGAARGRGSGGSWEPCGVSPVAGASLELGMNTPTKLVQSTNSEGMARFDLSGVEPTLELVRKQQAGVFVKEGAVLPAIVDISSCPLMAGWKETVGTAREAADKAAAAKRDPHGVKARVAAMSVEELRRVVKERLAAAPRAKDQPDGWDDEVLRAVLDRGCGNALDLQDAEVCYQKGVYFAEFDKNPIRARALAGQLFKMSCDKGYAMACKRSEIARWEADQRRLEQQAVAAPVGPPAPAFTRDLANFKVRCVGGDRAGCVMMTSIERCQQGVADGCDSAGNAFVGIVGIPKDLAQTKTYWTRACQLNAALCAGYGVKFFNTRGLPGNEQTADEFFELACRTDAAQCTTVGSMYRAGAGGLPRDESKARSYFERGCKGGAAPSCLSLQRR